MTGGRTIEWTAPWSADELFIDSLPHAYVVSWISEQRGGLMELARNLAYTPGWWARNFCCGMRMDKRNWAVIRKFLLEAADAKTAKGRSLLDVLYIPEMFNSERAQSRGVKDA